MSQRIVRRRIKAPDAPALGAVETVSTTELRVLLDRRASGPTRIDRYQLQRALSGGSWSTIAESIGIFGSDNDYEDTGLAPSTTYFYRCRAIDTTGRVSEWSLTSGTTAAAVNQGPAFTTAPASASFSSSGGVVQFTAVDPEGGAITYSLYATRTGVTINASTGLVTATSAAQGTSADIVVQATDPLGAYARATCLLTVAATSGVATYVIPASTSARTLNGGSSAGWSAFGPNRAPAGGDVIEFAAGSHNTLTLSNLVGSAGNPIIVRPATGALVTLTSTSSSFRWNVNNCQYLTIDGATSNAGASIPIAGAPHRCGFKMIGTGNCTAWIKFGITSRLPKSITIQYVEIAGSNTTGTCIMYNDDTGNRVRDYPNQWREDLAIRYNYFHNAGGLYIGGNYECDETGGLEVPCRRTTIEYNRIVNATEECLGLKQHWEGPNYVRYNWFEGSGRDSVGSSIDQRNAVSLQNSTVKFYGNLIFNSGQGNTAQGAGMGPSGIVLVANNGPDVTGVPNAGSGVPASAYSSYGPFPFNDIEIYNNVIVDSAWHGIQSSLGTLNNNKGPGVTTLVPQMLKVYNNTICTNQDAGVRVAAASAVVAGSSIDNNICIGNGSAFSGYAPTLAGSRNKTSGDTVASLFVDPTAGAYANRDYHLTKAVPVAGGSALGTTVATTDLDGDTRVLATADMGAYEYP